MGGMIFRCSDGHLYTENLVQDMFSLHLGFAKLQRCPVDKRWRMARPVPASQLTPEQLEEARSRHL